MLHPAAPQAGNIEWLYWVTFWILFAVFCPDDRGLCQGGARRHGLSQAIRFPSLKKDEGGDHPSGLGGWLRNRYHGHHVVLSCLC